MSDFNDLTAERLARVMLTVIGERYHDGPGAGYYGGYSLEVMANTPAEELRDVVLDGTDDFLAICEETLRRLRGAPGPIIEAADPDATYEVIGEVKLP